MADMGSPLAEGGDPWPDGSTFDSLVPVVVVDASFVVTEEVLDLVEGDVVGVGLAPVLNVDVSSVGVGVVVVGVL